MNDDRMSFLPEDYIERRLERRTNIICLSLFAVVLLGVLGAYTVTAARRSDVLHQQRRINAAFAEAAQRIAQLDQLQNQKRDLLRKARVTSALIEPVPRSNLLAELINRRPDTLSFLELEMTSKKLGPKNPIARHTGSAMNAAKAAEKKKSKDAPVDTEPEVPQYTVRLALIGVAPTDVQVAQYMASLARCSLLESVDLIFSEETRIDDLSMRRFRIEIVLDRQADVRHLEPLLARRAPPAAKPAEPGMTWIDPRTSVKD